MSSREPVFNVPGAVSGALLAIVAIHLVRLILSQDQDDWFVIAMAFIPGRYTEVAAELPGGEMAVFTSPFTHMLVHGDFMHLILNGAWLLAFGSAIARRTGNMRFLLLSVFCGLAGAAMFYAVRPGLMLPVVGASGALSGLMAATLRLLLSATDGGNLRELRDSPQSISLQPLSQVLKDRRLIAATAIWILLNVLAIYGVGSVKAEGGIAWEAHVGGFIAGLLGFGLFDAKREEISQPHNKPTLH
jgi:membrane associated rhomboid family serine protease